MDPLSVTASVVGLLAAGTKVAGLLQSVRSSYQGSQSLATTALQEIKHLTAIFNQIQRYIEGQAAISRDRADLIQLNDLVAILTDCVMTYSELASILEGLNIGRESNVGETFRTRDRLKLVREEQSIQSLIQRLQNQKGSLQLILQLIECNSRIEALGMQGEFRNSVNQLRDCSPDVARRTEILRDSSISAIQDFKFGAYEPSVITISTKKEPHLMFDVTKDQTRQPFDGELQQSRVYRQCSQREDFESVLSLGSTTLQRTAMSLFARQSLSEVSNLSFYALPIVASDIPSISDAFAFGESAIESPTTRELRTGDRTPENWQEKYTSQKLRLVPGKIQRELPNFLRGDVPIVRSRRFVVARATLRRVFSAGPSQSDMERSLEALAPWEGGCVELFEDNYKHSLSAEDVEEMNDLVRRMLALDISIGAHGLPHEVGLDRILKRDAILAEIRRRSEVWTKPHIRSNLGKEELIQLSKIRSLIDRIPEKG